MLVLSLFDYSGVSVEPWVRAGFRAMVVDIQHPPGDITGADGIRRVGMDVRNLRVCDIPRDVVFVSAFPPCDHLAVSGAAWFRGKGLRKLAEAIEMVAAASELCESLGAPYYIENPVSTLSTYWRKPDYMFDPCDYATDWAEAYRKRTCIWSGSGFIMPPKPTGLPPVLGSLGRDGPKDKNVRSRTPRGWAEAVFKANVRAVPA